MWRKDVFVMWNGENVGRAARFAGIEKDVS